MISVFVVEDEKHILESTLSMLQELGFDVAGSASTIDDAYAGIRKSSPKLVLLDVEVGSRKSFELLEKFNRIEFKVIFVTAHQKYALDAFRFSAVDFLLKPLSMSALEVALKKATESLTKDQDISLKALQYNLQTNSQDQKIILKTQDKIHVLKLEEIIHCESDQSYTIFHTLNGKIMVSKTLGYYDDLLSTHGFFRIHKSHLINLSHILQIHKADGGEVEMTDHSRIGISQRKKDEFLQQVDKLGLH